MRSRTGRRSTIRPIDNPYVIDADALVLFGDLKMRFTVCWIKSDESHSNVTIGPILMMVMKRNFIHAELRFITHGAPFT